MALAASLQPGLDQAPGNGLRGRRQRLARIELRAREPACVLQLAAHAYAAAGGRGGLKADHQRRRKRPRLRGFVAQAAHDDAGLLRHLALDRGGQLAWRPRSARSPSLTSTMMAGSMRGNSSWAQAAFEHTRMWPARVALV